MRWSNYFLPTLREDPKDAEAISHKLMLRAGLIRRLGSGAYSYLPLGMRALEKARNIVKEEMERVGAQAVLLPALQPAELWKITGRYELMGEVLIRFKDRTGKEMVLGPTHEEVITDLVKEINSHKQLPIILYQIQTKFRDEPRARFGVIRSKEFIMKDAYSFDVDMEGLNKSYDRMYAAYERIFKRAGLSVLACDADPGVMGGDVSHEFMAPAESGEDRVVRCVGCGYAANLEAAKCKLPVDGKPSGDSKPIEKVKTPGMHTVEQVSQFLKVTPQQLIKTLLYDVDKGDPVGVMVRGDHDVNEAKLARVLGANKVKLSEPKTIQRLTGAPVGFSGPVGLTGIKLFADHAVMGLSDAVAGANEDETHIVHVNVKRDVPDVSPADLRVVIEGDSCVSCGKNLEFISAIESGHVFKLGTKYSAALGAVYRDSSGAQKPMMMGCYGIGINRMLAAAIEQHHDKAGIVWPVGLAPFQVVVSVLDASQEARLKAGEDTYQLLRDAGLEVLLDDRQLSPGAKLKDADLIGIPVQVIVGKTWEKEQKLEVVARATKERATVTLDQLLKQARTLLE